MKIRIIVVILFLLIPLSACHRSGTWTDDAENWGRAFGTIKPADVVVVHSRYWRSSHFTYEFEYFFHIQRNDALLKQLFGSNRLKQVKASETPGFFKEKPSWFIPKPEERYDIWMYEKDPRGHFQVFIDKETQDIFIADFQA